MQSMFRMPPLNLISPWDSYEWVRTLAAGAAALPGVTRIARAQIYPTRPVRIAVGFAAGGSSDIAARLMGQWLSERLGQQFVIENRTGAAGNNIEEWARLG
jgi:tripartite-type tricarboxylate transporter receptor subunit TctC